MINRFISLSLVISTIALGACASGQTAPPSSSMEPALHTSSIDKAMEKALQEAEANGNRQQILATLRQVHSRNPKDPVVAARYARALRDDDQIKAASRVLSPFTKGDKSNELALTEMAMTKLAEGDFAAAESYAADVLHMNDKNARAYLALGTAQDAQGNHEAAEKSFRQGLRYWEGDATPIMNNLALNLASQGHLEEALSLIEKALEESPRRMDLERNRRIIATLLETAGPRPPAPAAKPAAEVKVGEQATKTTYVPIPPKKDIVMPTGAEDAAQIETTAGKDEIDQIVEENANAEPDPVQEVYQAEPKTNTTTNIKLKNYND